MNKNDFCKKLTEKVNMTKKEATVIIEAIGDIITEALVAGDDVTIPNVGKFSTKIVPEKTGVITFGDKAGEKYTSPEHNAPKFRFSATIKNKMK